MAHGQIEWVLRHVRRLANGGVGPALTDKQLLERFTRHQDESAFALVVDRHGPMVFAVGRRLLGDIHAAEDAFQATFLVLARRARSLGWHDSVANWLHGVALRTALREKAKTPVTATMNNVLFGTAVRLLADMTELRVVEANNVMYVTTKANAEAMWKEQRKRRAQVLPPRPPLLLFQDRGSLEAP